MDAGRHTFTFSARRTLTPRATARPHAGALIRGSLAQIAIGVLAFAASAASLANGFAIDDWIIIAGDDRVHRLAAPWRFFTQPYWPPPSTATLYRPLTSLAYAVEWQVGHGAPLAYHATNVLLYVLLCVAVYRLGIHLLDRASAWWVGALFAVHPVHVEAVANSVGQAELWAGLLVIVAVCWYIRIRRSAALARRQVVGVAALYLAAVLFKEHAVMLPVLLVGLELTVLGRPPSDLVRRADLRRLFVALTAVAAVFWTAHVLVTGSVAGDRPSWAFVGLSSSSRALTMLGVVPEWTRLLWVPLHPQVDYMPQEVRLAGTFGGRQWLGAVLLAALAASAVRARRRAPVLTFALVWVAVTLLPVSNLLLVSGITLAERTLLLPSVGATLAVGAALGWAAGRRLRWRRALAAVGVAILVAACALSAGRQRVWRNDRAFKAQALVDSPRSYRAHWWHGKRLYLAGDTRNAEREFELALRLFDGDPEMLGDVADHLASLERCDDAIDLYRRGLALAPERRWFHRRIVGCLIARGLLREAREEAGVALERGDDFADEDMARLDSLDGGVPRKSSGGR